MPNKIFRVKDKDPQQPNDNTWLVDNITFDNVTSSGSQQVITLATADKYIDENIRIVAKAEAAVGTIKGGDANINTANVSINNTKDTTKNKYPVQVTGNLSVTPTVTVPGYVSQTIGDKLPGTITLNINEPLLTESVLQNGDVNIASGSFITPNSEIQTLSIGAGYYPHNRTIMIDAVEEINRPTIVDAINMVDTDGYVTTAGSGGLETPIGKTEDNYVASGNSLISPNWNSSFGEFYYFIGKNNNVLYNKEDIKSIKLGYNCIGSFAMQLDFFDSNDNYISQFYFEFISSSGGEKHLNNENGYFDLSILPSTFNYLRIRVHFYSDNARMRILYGTIERYINNTSSMSTITPNSYCYTDNPSIGVNSTKIGPGCLSKEYYVVRGNFYFGTMQQTVNAKSISFNLKTGDNTKYIASPSGYQTLIPTITPGWIDDGSYGATIWVGGNVEIPATQIYTSLRTITPRDDLPANHDVLQVAVSSGYNSERLMEEIDVFQGDYTLIES